MCCYCCVTLMNAQQKKRPRAPNLSAIEKEFLANLAVKFAPVIENKKTNAVSAQEKELAWQQLQHEFVAAGGNQRDWHQLKHVCKREKCMKAKS